MTWHARPAAGLAVTLLCGVAFTTGCSQPDERFVRKSNQRLNRIDGLLTRFTEREAEGGQRLAVMGYRIKDHVQRHEEYFGRDLLNLRRWFERDVERWPRRRERIEYMVDRSMRGDPANIDRTIPPLFY
jgi:hypothetical protein